MFAFHLTLAKDVVSCLLFIINCQWLYHMLAREISKSCKHVCKIVYVLLFVFFIEW
jgi:hypothetical protein